METRKALVALVTLTGMKAPRLSWLLTAGKKLSQNKQNSLQTEGKKT